MKNTTLLQELKNAERDYSNNHPVEFNKELMSKVHGGGNSAGHVCTVSGECNSSGDDCGELLEKIIEILW